MELVSELTQRLAARGLILHSELKDKVRAWGSFVWVRGQRRCQCTLELLDRTWYYTQMSAEGLENMFIVKKKICLLLIIIRTWYLFCVQSFNVHITVLLNYKLCYFICFKTKIETKKCGFIKNLFFVSCPGLIKEFKKKKGFLICFKPNSFMFKDHSFDMLSSISPFYLFYK